MKHFSCKGNENWKSLAEPNLRPMFQELVISLTDHLVFSFQFISKRIGQIKEGKLEKINNKYFLIFNSPGQLCVLQSCFSCRSPGQSAPPCRGNGLSQNRCLLLFPPSQPLSHTVHDDHSPQAPSRGTRAGMGQFNDYNNKNKYNHNSCNDNDEFYD